MGNKSSRPSQPHVEYISPLLIEPHQNEDVLVGIVLGKEWLNNNPPLSICYALEEKRSRASTHNLCDSCSKHSSVSKKADVDKSSSCSTTDSEDLINMSQSNNESSIIHIGSFYGNKRAPKFQDSTEIEIIDTPWIDRCSTDYYHHAYK